MAVALNSRPIMAGFSPVRNWNAVKNPVVYKFSTTGGPFTNYRIEVEVFKASDNTSLTGGVKFSFTPDKNNVTYADVSTIVQAYLKAEWIKPAVLNEKETDTGLKVYIKYQELYDGSVTSAADDVANPIHCVLAGLQVKDVIKITSGTEFTNAFGGNMVRYQPGANNRKFLAWFDHPKLWRGYPATLSFIFPDAFDLFVSRAQYNSAGTIIGIEDRDQLTLANDDSVNRLDLLRDFTLNTDAKTLAAKLGVLSNGAEIITNPTFATSLSPWTNVSGSGIDWVWVASEAARISFAASAPPGANVSDALRQEVTEQAAGWYNLLLNLLGSVSKSVSIAVNVYNNGVLVQQILNDLLAVTTVATNFSYPVYIDGTFDRIEIVAELSGPDGMDFDVSTASLKPQVLTDYTETLTFDVEDACDNPVLLVWKNSLGGDSFWMFDHSQEAGYNLSGSKKAKRMTLFAEHLTLNQWEALNELNTLGEVYAENIIEFTSSVNKTHKRDGAQVYVLDASGNKTGVIVIPTTSVINTKDETHRIEIEIELPQRIE
jgi:hypothetical protein